MVLSVKNVFANYINLWKILSNLFNYLFATVGLGSLKIDFNDEQKTTLVDYIKMMEARLFGLTSNEVRFLV